MDFVKTEGRKEAIVVADHGRDQGKRYLLREWSAADAESWGMRFVFALNRGGSNIPIEHVVGLGMAGVAYVGFSAITRGNVDSEEMIPLLNELMACVQIIRDPNAVDPVTGGPLATPIVSEDDIEEVRTRLWLKNQVIELHTGFSPAGMISNWISAATASMSAGSQNQETSAPSSDTPSA